MNIDWMIINSPEKLYKLGRVVFLIVGVCQLINLFIFFTRSNIFSNIISIMNIIFSFAIAMFFNSMTKGSSVDITPEGDIAAALKELKKKR